MKRYFYHRDDYALNVYKGSYLFLKVMIKRLVLKVWKKKVPSDVMWVSIDGSLCIASCLTTEPALIEVYW